MGLRIAPSNSMRSGQHFYGLGWNVLIPRYPRHGYSDRLTTSIADLRSEQLIALANRAAEAGPGLGEQLTVAGLSLGGTLTGMLAQERESVECAVLIAPMLGLQRIPGPAHPVLAELAYVLPNFWVWWDSRLTDKLEPPYGYPRFSTHAYAALFKTATRVLKAARAAAPKARSISVITNVNEPGLDNRFTYQLVERWRRHGAAVSTFEFPTSERLPHDLIDPANPALSKRAQSRVYEVIVRYITGATN
jgi:pimeloyl-ACP methyl ester carboxylesterase